MIGYSALSTATIPIEPRVVATAISALAPVSNSADGEDERDQPPRHAGHGPRPGEREQDDGDGAEPGGGHRPRARSPAPPPRGRRRRARIRAPRRARGRRLPPRAAPRPPGSRETSTIPARASAMPAHCTAAGESPRATREGERHDGRGRRDGRHDAHRADRHPAVEAAEPDRSGDARRRPRRAGRCRAAPSR